MPEGPEYGSRSRTGLTGQDFGDKGRVYAVVPQTERADHPDMQGTFLLLHLLTRVLFKFGCIIFIIVASCVRDLGLKVKTSGNSRCLGILP